LVGTGAFFLAGCRTSVPAGYHPAAHGPADVQTAGVLSTYPGKALAPLPLPMPVDPKEKPKVRPFELPDKLPGAGAPVLVPPRFDKETPQSERDAAVKKAYPELTPVSKTDMVPADGAPLTLADLRQMGVANSPVIRRAAADADAAYGQVIQAGLHPNPTAGYQSDQVTPWLRIPPGSTIGRGGQQGGFLNQLIKTAGKLRLAQQVAGYDFINAQVAVRRAEVDVSTAVRGQYFAVLVARQGVEVNRALAALADEVYRLQLGQVAAGQAAGYEPLQVYSQAEQARLALIQSEAAYRAAWRQLAAAVGRPDLPPAPLDGSAEIAPPAFDQERLKAWMVEQHTDLLTGRNTLAQAHTNLTLARRNVIPDFQTNQYHEFDNVAQTYQYGLQLGFQFPVWDQNQGNIRTAAARIGRAMADLEAVQNDLTGRLAEAYARYETNRAAAARYRDLILPSLTRAYRALVRRYQVEPDKVGFNDVVVAQQNLATALQAYLTALDGQWRAVVDLANLGQLDDLFPPAPPPPAPPGPMPPPAPLPDPKQP
jgi:cobalt-zinc-cadmium efflux system outer membrane protein